jgi:hypothetical protein
MPIVPYPRNGMHAVLWSRSRKEPELLAGVGAGISKFRLWLPAKVVFKKSKFILNRI